MKKFGIKKGSCCVCGVDSKTAVCGNCIIKEEDKREKINIVIDAIKHRAEEKEDVSKNK